MAGYIHVPRTGGTSFYESVSNLINTGKASVFYEHWPHSTVKEAVAALPEAQDVPFFACVREPKQWLESQWAILVHHKENPAYGFFSSFSDMVARFRQFHPNWQTQSEFAKGVKFLFPYERRAEMMAGLGSTIGIPITDCVNPITIFPKPSVVWTDELTFLAENQFSEDFDLYRSLK